MTLKKMFWAFLLCVIIQNVNAQKVDSLKKVIDANVGLTKIEPIIEMVRYWVLKDNHEALKWATQASAIAESAGDTASIVRTSRIVCQLRNQLSMVAESEEVLLKILPIAKRHNLRDEHKKMLNLLGVVYIHRAKYDEALGTFVESLRMHEDDEDWVGASIGLSNIGLIYYKLKDYDNSLAYYIKSVELKKRLHDLFNLDILLINASLCYAFKKDYAKAMMLADSALRVCGNESCNDERKLEANYSFGIIHLGLKNITTAKNHFLNSYKVARKINDVRFELDNLIYLIDIAIAQNEIAIANAYLQKAEALMEREGMYFNLEMIKIYALFLKLYIQKKDYAKVTHYQQKYIQLKDSTYDEQLTNNLMRIEAEYLERENTDRITTQRQTIALKEEIIKGKKLLNIIIGTLAVILVLLAVILVMGYRNKQKLKTLLDRKVDERTKELQQMHEDLKRITRDKEVLIARSSEDINKSMVTINGLCAVGLQDVSDLRGKEYILKLHTTSNQLSGIIRGLKSLRTIYQ
jgi:tetratricopeptide (TPR) repeat protein